MDFYMKFVTHYDDPYMSMATVYVDGLTESGWKTVAYIYASYLLTETLSDCLMRLTALPILTRPYA